MFTGPSSKKVMDEDEQDNIFLTSRSVYGNTENHLKGK